MTTIKKLELESVFFIVLGAMVGVFFVGQAGKTQKQFHSLTNLPAMAADSAPTPIQSEPTIEPPTLSSQISPDGTKKVEMKITPSKNDSKTYEISTSDGDGQSYDITKITLDAKSAVTLPFNTWSPDNRYFFIKEDTQNGPLVMVFKATGEAFPDGALSLDLTKAFENRATGNNFVEATGWASETLIIINTTHTDKTQGPSYWFEVPSKAIIQLSTQF